MSTIRPFRGLRPVPKNAATVSSPPYDVLSSSEARTMAKGNPWSFLHVIKPEIDFDPAQDPYADEVYQKGRENLQQLMASEVTVRDEMACLYLYEQRMQIGDIEHVQVGLMAGVSVDEYQRDLIKKHELTRPEKEADRTRHIDVLNANTGPVFLTYAADETINGLVSRACQKPPEYDFVADDGIGHRLWVISDEKAVEAFVSAFGGVSHLYVADGHHRTASSAAVGARRREQHPNFSGDEPFNFFLAVIFPHDQMYIMDYNRVVTDMGTLSPAALLERVGEKFEVSPTDSARPSQPRDFGLYVDGKWYRLRAKPGTFDPADPVKSLDVAILQENLLAPVLGIEDPRRDERIDFVGGIRGTAELERRVNEGAALAVAMYPTSIEQLMAIADAGAIMPPKSTWFEPKLRSGLVVRLLDE